MRVVLGDVGALTEQALRQGGRLQAQRQELVVPHDEVVLLRLDPRVRQVRDLHAHHVAHHLGQVEHAVGFGDLVEYPGPVPRLGRVADGQLDAPHGVADVDERPGLPAGAVHRQRVPDGGLHQEPVEHGAVVAVVVEPVDQPLVLAGLRGLRTPHDALVQVGDPHPVVLGVEREHQLVERLGHVVHRPGIRRVQDLPLQLTVRGGHLHGQVALGNRRAAGPPVPVDAHGAQVRQGGVDPGLHERGQQVVRGPDVVVHRVALGRRGPHRVRRRPLLSEVHDRVRPQLGQHRNELVVLGGQVQADEADLLAGDLFPDPDPLADRPDRRQRLDLQVDVDLATAQIIDDGHIVATVRQVKRGRPATETIAAQNQNAHSDSHHVPPFTGTPFGRCRWGRELKAGRHATQAMASRGRPVYPDRLSEPAARSAYKPRITMAPARQPWHPSQARGPASSEQKRPQVSSLATTYPDRAT